MGVSRHFRNEDVDLSVRTPSPEPLLLLMMLMLLMLNVSGAGASFPDSIEPSRKPKRKLVYMRAGGLSSPLSGVVQMAM